MIREKRLQWPETIKGTKQRAPPFWREYPISVERWRTLLLFNTLNTDTWYALYSWNWPVGGDIQHTTGFKMQSTVIITTTTLLINEVWHITDLLKMLHSGFFSLLSSQTVGQVEILPVYIAPRILLALRRQTVGARTRWGSLYSSWGQLLEHFLLDLNKRPVLKVKCIPYRRWLDAARGFKASCSFYESLHSLLPVVDIVRNDSFVAPLEL